MFLRLLQKANDPKKCHEMYVQKRTHAVQFEQGVGGFLGVVRFTTRTTNVRPLNRCWTPHDRYRQFDNMIQKMETALKQNVQARLDEVSQPPFFLVSAPFSDCSLPRPA